MIATFSDQMIAIDLDRRNVTRLYELCSLMGCRVRTDAEIEAAYGANLAAACAQRIETLESAASDPWVSCAAVSNVLARAKSAYSARFQA